MPEATESEPGPGLALHLREQFPAVRPSSYGGHRQHWNTVILDGTVPAEELAEMIGHSWAWVVAKLPRPARERLQLLHSGRPDPEGAGRGTP
ncbi:MmcQ/YjbR family DNA-binding protein [Streptomyces sp. NPDC090045]|uniref:MmcQ/YjbR family DNA-binding protein n=1 Tax=Streptomyces sp. NPDC090045 TaxID=3365927 RepID=UPI00381D607E